MIPLLKPQRPRIDEAMKLFQTAADTGQLSNFGALHRKLQARLDDLTGGFALPVATGTAAIEVALAFQGYEEGDRIACPDFTHAGTLLAIKRAGLQPVLFGVDPNTWVLNPLEIEEAFTRGEIEGAVVVSPFGYHVNVEGWDELQARTGLGIVYDFAGRFGDWPRTINPVAYSFHATKNFGVGEGGMVLFASDNVRKDAQRLINFDTMPNREIASLNGNNLKLDELKCAFLLAGLQPEPYMEVMARIATKRLVRRRYLEEISGTESPSGTHFPSLIVLGNLPAELLEFASEKEGITFKQYYPLLSRMEGLDQVPRYSSSPEVMRFCCALPCDVNVSEARRVIEVVNRYAKENTWKQQASYAR